MIAAALALAGALQAGELVTIAHGTDRWCARVASIADGPAGPIAWVVVLSLGYPQPALRVLVRDLERGCADG